MKVCHFVAQVGLGRGDAFVPLANALCEHISIVMLVPEDARFLTELDPRVKIYRYQHPGGRHDPRFYWELWRLFREIKPDLVHTHFAKATEVFARLNRLLRLPMVATKHNPRKGRIFNRVAPVIAVSEGVKQSIRHDQVEVIHNGIVIEPVDRTSPALSCFEIIAVGRLTPIKGFDRLLGQLATLDFAYRLTVLGDGEQREILQRQAELLGIADRVVFAGFVTDVAQRIAHSHLQVMSSHSEGFSLAMIEAVFYAPVFISTPVPGCTEILPAQFLSEQHDLAAKISDVHANYADYCEQFAQLRSQLASDLSIPRGASRHLQVYRQLLDH